MILVAGSANLDFVIQVPHIPTPGETVLGDDLVIFPGGKGANQAVACARAGAETEMLLALGDDWLAERITRSLSDAGVRMHRVTMTDRSTGAALISVSANADNAIAVAPGAANGLSAADLPPLAGYSHLLMQLETPLSVVSEYARAARNEGVKVVLNAAPARYLEPELLSMVEILIVNEAELAVVAGHRGNVATCVERLAVPSVVVTLGDRGCCAKTGDDVIVETAFVVNAVDTTAAGDTFCGVLVAELGRGQRLRQALGRANAAGALACTRRGAQSSIPDRDAVDDFLMHQPAAAAALADALADYCGFQA